MKFKFDATSVLGIVGGVLVLGGQVIKGIVDKKNTEATLKEMVDKVVDEKLKN